MDDDEHLDGSESGITDIDSAMDITHGQKSQKRKSQDGIPNDQPKQVKKVVLNRTSSNTDVTHNNSTDDSIEKDKVDEKKVVKLSELSAKDVNIILSFKFIFVLMCISNFLEVRNESEEIWCSLNS